MNTGTQMIQMLPPPAKMLKVRIGLGSSEVFSGTCLLKPYVIAFNLLACFRRHFEIEYETECLHKLWYKVITCVCTLCISVFSYLD